MECYRVSLVISSVANITFLIHYLSVSLLANASHILEATQIHQKGSLNFLKLGIQGQMVWYRWKSHRLDRWPDLYSEVEGTLGYLDPVIPDHG